MIRLGVTLRTSEGAGALEADLDRYHGIDLLDLFRRDRPLTWRQVLVRWRNLPPTSATRRLDGAAWTPVEDMIDLWRRQWLSSLGVPDPGAHPMSPMRAIDDAAAELKAAETAAHRLAAMERAEQAQRVSAARAAYEAQQEGEVV